MSTPTSRYEQLLGKPQVRALLNTLRYAEGTAGDAGYQTKFTGAKFDPNKSGWRHPRTIMGSPGGYRSDAAGAYQFLSTTWDGVQKELGLKDFSPKSQDIAALRLIERRGALDPFLKGEKFGVVMNKLAPEWASLPTTAGRSYYGQPVKKLGDLYNYYEGQKQTVGAQPPAALPATQTPPSGTSTASVGKEKGNELGSSLLQRVMGVIPFLQQQRKSYLPSTPTPDLSGQSFLNTYRMFFGDELM
jgi:muramidase (phage lysozyme)